MTAACIKLTLPKELARVLVSYKGRVVHTVLTFYPLLCVYVLGIFGLGN